MRRRLLHVILLVFILSSCSSPVTAQAEQPVAEKPVVTATPDVNLLSTQAVATVYAALTAAAPTVTPTISIPTPTIVKPAIRFDADTNCRSGPGIKFELVAVIKAGQTAEPLGAPAQGNYWVVKNPAGSGSCWVVRDFATPAGTVAALPKMTAPPTYTAMPMPVAPALNSWDFECVYAYTDTQSASTATVVLKWADSSDYEIGYSVYRNTELIADLPANSTTFTHTSFLSYAEVATYYVQAYNYDGAARSKEIKVSCQ